MTCMWPDCGRDADWELLWWGYHIPGERSANLLQGNLCREHVRRAANARSGTLYGHFRPKF